MLARMIPLNQIEVCVEVSSLERFDSGSITGVIYFTIGGSEFPERGWSDFPVVILSWWLDAVAQSKHDRSPSIECDFMDGPYLVEVVPLHGDLVRLDCVEDRAERQIETSAQTTFAGFRSTLLRAAKLVEHACSKKGWETSDTLEFSRSITRFERQFGRA